MATDESRTILALCDQLRRIASFTIDDSGHISDPDLLYHAIERHVLALESALDSERSRWRSILVDASGVVVIDGGERQDLVSWLNQHANDAPKDTI